jgi:hypothetical protein
MSHPIIKISAYKAWKNRPGCKPYDTDFYSEMERIKNGAYKDVVDKCREITDEEERKKYKVSYLPSLTISAVCRQWRKLENVVSHTGLLNIDIDAKSNPHITDFEQLRDQLFELNGVVACFLSVSGRGVTFVVRVNPEQHKDTFYSIVDELKVHMGINADAGVNDVTRLRFVSYDPNCCIRYDFNSLPILGPSRHYLQSKKNFGSSDFSLEPSDEADSEHNYNEAVKKAEYSYAFQQGQKWNFLVSVAGSCNIMGMSLQYCIAQTLKRFSGKSDATDEQLKRPIEGVYKLYKSQHGTYDIEAAFDRLNWKVKRYLINDWLHEGNKPNAEDIINIAKEHDANPDRVQYLWSRLFNEYQEELGYKHFPKIKKVEVWLSKRWEFRFNKVTGQPELKEIGADTIDQVNVDEVYRQLELNGLKYNLNNVKSLMRSAFVKPYDPIREYFNSTSYDGKTDHIGKLAGYIQTTNQTFWEQMFKKSLVRSIACGLGIKENRIVMVLYGRKQETGKSTFIRFLSPWKDGKYFTESPIIGGNQKDTEIRFSENFIYNLEELAGLSRVDVNKLKADISKSIIKERRAYAMFETSAPRRCNFWASTNQREFLHDEENTRWLIFDINAINWAYKADINIHQVWGQAWHLFNNGFDFELSDKDRENRDLINDDYRYRRPEEELLVRYFKPNENKEMCKFFSSTEIATILNNVSPSLRINPNNIGKTIAAVYGIESSIVKINGKPSRGYWLVNVFSDPDKEPEKQKPPATTINQELGLPPDQDPF